MKKSLLTHYFFKAIYLIISFFIGIGELAKKVLFLPIKYFIVIFESSRKWRIPKVKLPKIHFPVIKLPVIKLPAVKIPSIEFPKMKLLKIRSPKLHFTKRIFLKFRYFSLGVILTLIALFAFQSYRFVEALPDPANIGKTNYSLSTHIYDRNGKLLYEIYRDQNRTPVTLNQLPSYVGQATIAIEDKDFYHHGGISLTSGIIRAIRDMAIEKNLQGGSTITQQLVKTALLTPDRTIQRKIKEIILALWAERLFTKNQILEMYLNQVPYGGASYGIEEAAKLYFDKDAKDLTLVEAATLAGLPQAPSLYSPYSNPQMALTRRNEVLKAMYDQKYINKETYEKAINTQLDFKPLATTIHAPHFVFYVKSQLENAYGINQVEEGGLKVTTTLDLDIQEEAEKILNEELAKVKYLNITNGAVLVTRPSTGEILAMVGSANYFATPSGAFNVTTALRQPGSSIKPVMYSLALQKGYTAATILDDSPVVFQSAGAPPYQPVNYDLRYHGKVPLRYALANSFNIPAVKVLNTIGVPNFLDYAQKMGISTWTDNPSHYGLSLTLGGGEVTMLDMATAYGVLANRGYKIPPTYYLKIDGNNDVSSREFHPFKIREIDEGITYIISDILSDNFARQWEFGTNSGLEIPGYKVAVKTGTTDNKKDNWTIGYTPDFLVIVWVGNNDNTPMNQALASGITGAAPIWHRVMTYLLKNYGGGNQWYLQPDDVVAKKCYYGRKEYFLKGTEKTACSDTSLNVSPTPTNHP